MGSAENEIDAAASALRASLALVRGHFLYESGHHGELWLDLHELFVDAARMRRWAAALAGAASGCRPQLVCGPLVGGALLAQLVAAELGAEFVFAERHAADGEDSGYRLPQALRRRAQGRRVLLVDDAVNAGWAWRSTLEDLDHCGAELAGLATLVTLGVAARELAGERRAPLFALDGLSHDLWPPGRCPLCRAGQPLTYEAIRS